MFIALLIPLIFIVPLVTILYYSHQPFIMELKCKVQNYDWGKLGQDSMVAKLVSSADPNESIDNTKPYAELWMGTHPNGPSLIIERNVFLSDYIEDNLDAIGPAVRKKFDVSVPFLLKILSIRKALSIQAHPKKVMFTVVNDSYLDKEQTVKRTSYQLLISLSLCIYYSCFILKIIISSKDKPKPTKKLLFVNNLL